jgi:peptidoglycan hydrolase-like protein with peptidoglycan-binding domain
VAWQFLLIAVHHSRISADGVFGPQTERATKGFQRSKGIEATGGVGHKTTAAMNGAVDWLNARR